jgi:hypothetical protein
MAGSAIALGAVCRPSWPIRKIWSDPMTLLEWAQFAALILAGLFFAYKLLTGWLMVNLSLSGNLERTTKGDGWDTVVVAITLTKGSLGSARIQSTEVRASWPGGSKSRALEGAWRLAVSSSSGVYTVNQPWERARKRPLYRLPPNESTVWSCVVDVPTGATCHIEAVVIGVQLPNWWHPGQWRCSLISAPEKGGLIGR